MTAELDREDIIHMLLGTQPRYGNVKLIKKLEQLKLGDYIGGFANEWRWEDAWYIEKYNPLSDEELYELYKELKKN